MDEKQIVTHVLKNYRSIAKHNPRYQWSEERKRFTIRSASKFFIGCMLDMGQDAERAWEGGRHFVENYFDSEDIWFDIADTHLNSLKKTCTRGFNGKAFATHVHVNKFAPHLKANAKIMVDEYDGDPRNIWNGLTPENVDELYDRMLEFHGIGDALAKMAQFILVRNYGVAGGSSCKKLMSVKPDIHLQRVLHRMGIIDSISAHSVIEWTESVNLKSPADFDLSVWTVGAQYCSKTNPSCEECPFDEICEKNVA